MSEQLIDRTPQRWIERDRVAALRALNVLHTPPESDFDDLVTLASKLCGAPTAMVSLVDSDTQWFKARIGIDLEETPRGVSFCDYAMREDGVMVVPDATLDPRFADNPEVTGGLGIRFYAGAPLVTDDGFPLGALCVIDYAPRPEGLDAVQTQALAVLARQVVSQIALRHTVRALRASQDTARRALHAADFIGAWDWDVASNLVTADERFARLYDVAEDLAAAGVPLSDFGPALHAEDLERVRQEMAAALISDDGVFQSEYRLLVPGEPQRWVVARGQVYYDADRIPVRMSGLVVDITEHKFKDLNLAAVTAALAESEAMFRAMADSLPQMVWASRADGVHDYYNARWREFAGETELSHDPVVWSAILHPEDRARVLETWSRSLATGAPYEVECRLKTHDGAYRWTLGRATPVRDAKGQITRWFGAYTDIDDLKHIEQSKELLSQELSHRIKNIFAVITALIGLSAREYPEAKGFATSVRRRIDALSKAHEYVRPHNLDRAIAPEHDVEGGATLHAFLQTLFAPYADDEGQPCVTVSGDDALFDDQAATSVALLFHELATNAAKYGALSLSGGRVDLTTSQEGERFVLVWKERGGPELDGAPERSGFGSSLVTVSVEAQLGGRLERKWEVEGLTVIADLPATALSRRRAALNLV